MNCMKVDQLFSKYDIFFFREQIQVQEKCHFLYFIQYFKLIILCEGRECNVVQFFSEVLGVNSLIACCYSVCSQLLSTARTFRDQGGWDKAGSGTYTMLWPERSFQNNLFHPLYCNPATRYLSNSTLKGRSISGTKMSMFPLDHDLGCPLWCWMICLLVPTCDLSGTMSFSLLFVTMQNKTMGAYM